MAAQQTKNHFLGRSLAEEVVFCLLGGHGMPAEVGLAASRRVCAALPQGERPTLSQANVEALLREPLIVRGKGVRYRFAAQRARYLSGTLEGLKDLDESRLTDTGLRDALTALPGIGPKTASWVVRNWRASNRVAILDIHIVRACTAIGVFPHGASPARGYLALERQFLAFCEATRARASAMDAVMWATMRRLSPALLQQLIDPLVRFAQPYGPEQRGNRSCPDRMARAMMNLG